MNKESFYIKVEERLKPLNFNHFQGYEFHDFDSTFYEEFRFKIDEETITIQIRNPKNESIKQD